MQSRLAVKYCSPFAHSELQVLSTLTSFLLTELKILKVIRREGIKLTSLVEVPIFGRVIYKESNQFSELFLQNAIDRRNTKKYSRLCEIFKLRHVNVAAYYGIVKDGRTISGFLTESVSQNTLNTYVTEDEEYSLKEIKPEQVVRYSIQVARALTYCHEMNVVHGDVHPRNILLTKDESTAKLGNFNFELNPDPTLTVSYSRQDYSAPEVILGTKYSPASDVYSFGMLVYSLIFQRTPFQDSLPIMNNPLHFRHSLERGSRPQFSESHNFSPELQGIVEKCWRTVASERPKMKDVLQRLCQMRDGLPFEEEEELEDWDLLDKMDCLDVS